MRIQRVMWLVPCFAATVALGAGDLVQVKQDFSSDPGWEGVSNRCEATNPPAVKQDFGWNARGEVGGKVWQSTTPAWYGAPLERPLTFKDKFSASGKIRVMPVDPAEGARGAAAYLGFFNHERQGWRPWNTMAIRLSRQEKKVSLYLDHTTGIWNAGAAEMELNIPTDGSEHTWKLTYDPDATRPAWTDMRLRSYLTNDRQTPAQLLAKARANGEPDLTPEALEKRLRVVLGQGLVNFLPRHGTQYWLLKQENENLKGAVTVQVDDGMEFRTFLPAAHQDQPVALDRFGIYNMQLYHGLVEFYVSDLTLNGKKVDLSKDPGWDGQGNRAEYAERDFQRQNFGYSAGTNHAGGGKGEIGGQFYNVEPIDPLHGYYADDVGKLTLDDPIRFSGKLAFMEGSTDAGMFFGFFRAEDERRELPANVPNGKAPGWPQPNVLGVVVDGPARIGWYFIPTITAAKPELNKDRDGMVILPTRQPRTFDFQYDPAANNGVGRITVTLDGNKPVTVDLTPEQRKAGATFDRFGLMSFRRGGKFSTLYFDDLTYTARRPAGYQPVRHEQKITYVEYPRGGRKY